MFTPVEFYSKGPGIVVRLIKPSTLWRWKIYMNGREIRTSYAGYSSKKGAKRAANSNFSK